MRITSIVLPAAITSLAFASPALAVGPIPQIEQVNEIKCQFNDPTGAPYNIEVKLGDLQVGDYHFTFRNTVTAQELVISRMVNTGGRSIFQVPAGQYLLSVKRVPTDRMFGGYSGIVVRPFAVETVNGQKICKDANSSSKGVPNRN
jgi:carbohydrate-selective porin OprB